MKIRLFFNVIMVLSVCLFSSCRKDAAVVKTSDKQNDQYALQEGPKYSGKAGNNGAAIRQSFDFLPSSTTNQIVSHEYFTLSYSEKYEQAEWVAYELKKVYLKNNSFKRPFFIEDP